jgi:hypothetical protein
MNYWISYPLIAEKECLYLSVMKVIVEYTYTQKELILPFSKKLCHQNMTNTLIRVL